MTEAKTPTPHQRDAQAYRELQKLLGQKALDALLQGMPTPPGEREMNTQKAIEFANKRLGYSDAYVDETSRGTFICDRRSARDFSPDSITDLQKVVEEFLGNRYWLQVNRDLTGLFQWTAIVGQQNLIEKTASFEHAKGTGDIADAMFDACVAAMQMDRREG